MWHRHEPPLQVFSPSLKAELESANNRKETALDSERMVKTKHHTGKPMKKQPRVSISHVDSPNLLFALFFLCSCLIGCIRQNLCIIAYKSFIFIIHSVFLKRNYLCRLSNFVTVDTDYMYFLFSTLFIKFVSSLFLLILFLLPCLIFQSMILVWFN